MAIFYNATGKLEIKHIAKKTYQGNSKTQKCVKGGDVLVEN